MNDTEVHREAGQGRRDDEGHRPFGKPETDEAEVGRPDDDEDRATVDRGDAARLAAGRLA